MFLLFRVECEKHGLATELMPQKTEKGRCFYGEHGYFKSTKVRLRADVVFVFQEEISFKYATLPHIKRSAKITILCKQPSELLTIYLTR